MGFDDTGLGQAMANSSYEASGLRADDAIVLIGWLSERLRACEELLAVQSDYAPILPSRIHGFACIPKRSEAVADAMKRVSEVGVG